MTWSGIYSSWVHMAKIRHYPSPNPSSFLSWKKERRRHTDQARGDAAGAMGMGSYGHQPSLNFGWSSCTASFTQWAPPWRCLWSPVNHHLAIIRRQIFDAKEGRWQSICSLEIHLEWLRRTMLVMTGWRGPRLLPRRWWQGDCEQDNGGKMEPDMDCSKPMVALWTVLRLDQTILSYILKRSISGCSIWTTSIVHIYLQNFESLL